MQCEMCGKGSVKLVTAKVEGATLKLCPACARHGQVVENVDRGGRIAPAPRPATAPDPSTLQRGLERRHRRRQERDVFSMMNKELVLDYGDRVRTARNRLGMTRVELARKINEKESVVAEVEKGDMIPDEKLTGKLERALNIKLQEAVQVEPSTPASPGKGSAQEGGDGLTLGDLILREKE